MDEDGNYLGVPISKLCDLNSSLYQPTYDLSVTLDRDSFMESGTAFVVFIVSTLENRAGLSIKSPSLLAYSILPLFCDAGTKKAYLEGSEAVSSKKPKPWIYLHKTDSLTQFYKKEIKNPLFMRQLQ